MTPTRRGEFINGMRMTIPLVIGAVPFGIIFGALAVTSGLSPAGASAMSLMVFAGSAQFIATGLIASGTSVALIVVTTLIVNLRHSLYAISLAPYMKNLSQRWLVPLSFWLTDESYVVVIRHFQALPQNPHKHWFFLGSAVLMYLNWQLSTVVGIWAGQSIPNPGQWGLDFALIVTFIGMVVPMLKNRPVVASVLVASVIALLLRGLPNQLGLLVATFAGILAGVWAENITGPSKAVIVEPRLSEMEEAAQGRIDE